MGYFVFLVRSTAAFAQRSRWIRFEQVLEGLAKLVRRFCFFDLEVCFFVSIWPDFLSATGALR